MTEGQTWDKVRWCEIIIATDVMYYYDDDFTLVESFANITLGLKFF